MGLYFILKPKLTLFYFFSFALSRYHSLSFLVTRCTNRCHSLLDVPLVSLFINDRFEFFSFQT